MDEQLSQRSGNTKRTRLVIVLALIVIVALIAYAAIGRLDRLVTARLGLIA